MIQSVVSAVHETLKGANTSRSFTVQTLLPGATNPSVASGSGSRRMASGGQVEGEEATEEERQARADRKKAAPNYKVRTDLKARTLDEMLGENHPSQVGGWVESQPRLGRAELDGRGGKRRALGENKEDAVILDETDDDEVDQGGEGGYGIIHDTGGSRGRGIEIQESMCEFSSIAELRKAVKKKGNTGELSSVLLEK